MIGNDGEKKIVLKLSLIPIFFLLTILIFPIPFYIKGIFNYIQYMPLIVFFSGIIVIAVGAFWDFGAKIYVKDLMDSKAKITDEDIVYIHKKQLKMTLVYLGIGMIYFLVAFIIYYL